MVVFAEGSATLTFLCVYQSRQTDPLPGNAPLTSVWLGASTGVTRMPGPNCNPSVRTRQDVRGRTYQELLADVGEPFFVRKVLPERSDGGRARQARLRHLGVLYRMSAAVDEGRKAEPTRYGRREYRILMARREESATLSQTNGCNLW